MPFPPRNVILQRLPAAERALLEPLIQPVTVFARQTVTDPGEAVEALWFPEGAVASIVAMDDAGLSVEAASVGYDGLVGLPLLLGSGTSPMQTVWQIPGDAIRLPGRTFIAMREQLPGLVSLAHLYASHEMVQMGQSAACNRLHDLERRCARWLMQMYDRVGSKEFPLTHEYLGTMLGVHRPSVTLAVGALAARGLIAYRRGVVTVVDPAGLDAASCACHGIIVADHARLFGGKPSSVTSAAASA